jgi:hypothetical protein
MRDREYPLSDQSFQPDAATLLNIYKCAALLKANDERALGDHERSDRDGLSFLSRSGDHTGGAFSPVPCSKALKEAFAANVPDIIKAIAELSQ